MRRLEQVGTCSPVGRLFRFLHTALCPMSATPSQPSLHAYICQLCRSFVLSPAQCYTAFRAAHCTALHGAALMQGCERTHCGRGHSEGATGRIRSRGHVRDESSASEKLHVFHPHTVPFTLNPPLHIYSLRPFYH